jgi:hypothetical protein
VDLVWEVAAQMIYDFFLMKILKETTNLASFHSLAKFAGAQNAYGLNAVKNAAVPSNLK